MHAYTSNRRALQLLAGACLFALVRSASGQVPASPASPAHDAALAEFQRARQLMDSGDCAGAVPHLEASVAHEPSVGARLNIAECVEKTEPLRAWRALSEAALIAYATGDERINFVEKRLGDLEHLVPLLVVAMSKADLARSRLEVSIDGTPMDRAQLRRGIAVGPGAHLVEVRAPGKALWSERVVAPAAGDVTRLAVALADRAPEPPAASMTAPAPAGMPREPQASRRTVGLALGATGVAAVAAGAVFGVLALNKRGELDDACGGSRQSCSGRAELVVPIRDNASTLAAVSTASFVVGGAALAGGLALYFWPGGHRPVTGAVRTRVVPVTGVTQGISLEGAF